MKGPRRIQLALQPYMEGRPSLTLAKYWIVIKPLHHIYRGITFSRLFASGEFVANWSISPMFDRIHALALSDGRVIYAGSSARFFLNDPSSLEAFFAEIDNNIVPMLEPVRSIDDFVPFVDGTGIRSPVARFPRRHVKILAALGRFDEALEIALAIAEGRNGWAPPDLRESWEPIVTDLLPLLQANDRAGVATLLRRWEAEWRRNMACRTSGSPLLSPSS
ncbi:MAG: hypothetical protein JNK84_06560 [Phreatobacter sp.]|uniref:hypothetical protein n=1 Tax=Phreatobacter sp. TaxID=1966341 RepID=UPI001A492406|nr:hypothetical protein [Phreatobacter sp.]MBL8568731.1 hypothetical protein [Phreatobacter sp.]